MEETDPHASLPKGELHWGFFFVCESCGEDNHFRAIFVTAEDGKTLRYLVPQCVLICGNCGTKHVPDDGDL